MRLAAQNSNQLQTVFGGGYVQEQHRDEAFWNLSTADVGEVVGSLTVSMFGEVLKSLRAALSLK